MSIDLFAWLRAPGWAALAGAAALLTVHTASAQDCKQDSDCDDGYVCKSGGPMPCANVATPACAPGEKCPDPQPVDCQAMEYKYCAPAPCAEDSDCPDDMACFEYSTGGCTSGGSAPPMDSCKPGTDCAQADAGIAPPPEPDCTSETIHECTPRYRLPCEHDADCGDGFKCKEQVSGSCSGSSGTGTSGGSSGSDPGAGGKGGAQDGGMAEPPPVPEPPTCTSEPTGEFMCELQELPCETVDDCPANFECQDNPNRAVCMSAGTRAGSGGSAAIGAPDAGVDPGDNAGNAGAGGAPDDSCGGANDGVPKSVCLPRGYYTSGGGSRSASDEQGTTLGTSGGAKSDDGASVTTPADGNGGNGGSTGSTTTHTAAGSGADTMDATKPSGSGCAVAAPGNDAGNGWGLLGALGMSALLLRRRARKAA